MSGLLSGVLPAVYGAGNKLRRNVNSLLADPKEYAAGLLMDANTRAGGLLNMTRQAADEDVASLKAGGSMGKGPANQQLAQTIADSYNVGAMFAGVGAKTADVVKLKQAQALLGKGANPADVWRETGWAKGPDGQWRFEIDDSIAKLRDYQFTPAQAYQEAKWNAVLTDGTSDKVKAMEPYLGMTKNQLTDEYKRTGGLIVDAARSGNKEEAMRLLESRKGLDDLLGAMGKRDVGPASSFLAHGDLGKAYPDVYKLHTRVDEYLPERVAGQYMRETPQQREQIVLAKRPAYSTDKSNLLHEMQHAIQAREGFARGGSADNIARDPMAFASPDWVEYAKTLPAYERQASERAKDEFVKSYVQMQLGSPHDAYRRLAGEAEARLVEARMKMPAAERAAQFPWEPEYFEKATGVPLNGLLFR